MSADLDERCFPIATTIARSITRRFRKYVEFEDMQQEALAWFVKNRKKTDEFLADGKGGERKLGLSVKRHCEREARKQKAQQLGGSVTDEFFYEISHLSDMLPFMFDHQNWGQQPTSLETERVSGSRQPSEGGNWTAQMADLSRAFDTLGVDDRRLLRRYYRDEWTFRMLAKTEQVSESAARSEIGRAMTRLLDALGGASPWS